MPKPPSSSALKPLSVRLHRTGAGVRLVTCRMPGLRTAQAVLFVHRGALDDPPGRRGTNHLLEHSLGSGSLPGLGDLGHSVEARGGNLDAGEYLEYVRLQLTVWSGDLPWALSVLSGILERGPDVGRLEEERQAALAETRALCDQPEMRALGAAPRLIYPEVSSLGLDEDCLRELERVTARELADAWATVEPGELLLVALSPEPHQAMGEMAEAALGRAAWSGGRCAPVAGPGRPGLAAAGGLDLPGGGRRGGDRPCVRAIPAAGLAEQCYLALPLRLPVLTNLKDYYAARLVEAAYCRGFGSRLFPSLRGAGLVYDLDCDFEFCYSTPWLVVTTSTRLVDVPRVVEILLRELHALGGGLDPAEASRALSFFRGRVAAFLDDPMMLASWVGRIYLTYGRLPRLLDLEEAGGDGEGLDRLARSLADPDRRGLVVVTEDPERLCLDELEARVRGA